jgi:hypothetical protein
MEARERAMKNPFRTTKAAPDPTTLALNTLTALCREILAEVDTIQRKEDAVMSAQDDILAATQLINGLVSGVATDVSTLVNTDFPAIQAALAALQGQGVDTTDLNAAVAAAANTLSSLDSATAEAGTLVPPAPTS